MTPLILLPPPRRRRERIGILLVSATLLALAPAAASPPVAPSPAPNAWRTHSPWTPDDEARLAHALLSAFQSPASSIPSVLAVPSVPSPNPDSAKLPPPRGSREITLLLRDLRLRFDQLSPDTRQTLAPLLARPNASTSFDYVDWGPVGSFTESTVSSSRFVVHYVSAPPSHGSRATTTFAQTVLASLDQTADVENNALGWPAPPSDNFYVTRDNGGDGRYDIYLADVGGYTDPLFGYVAPEEYAPSAGSAATSYMVLDNDYAFAQYAVPDPLDALHVTVAHEYNHACQFALNFDDPEMWFYESTATHLEDLVFNDINDYYRFLPGFFNFPDTSLRSDGYSSSEPSLSNHPYGAAVWNHYLASRFGNDLILHIWEDTATGGSSHPTLFQTTQSRLALIGTTLPDEFARFAACNFLTGSRGGALYYLEGPAWPEVKVLPEETISSFPAGRALPPLNGLQPLAAAYIVLTPGPARGTIRFSFAGQETVPWRLYRVASIDGATELAETLLDPDASATVDVEDAHRYNWIAFVAANVATTGSTATRTTFAYSAVFDPALAASDRWLLAP